MRSAVELSAARDLMRRRAVALSDELYWLEHEIATIDNVLLKVQFANDATFPLNDATLAVATVIVI